MTILTQKQEETVDTITSAYLSLAKNSIDLISVHDITGQLLHCDKSAWERFHLPTAHLKTRSFLSVLLKEEGPKFLKAISQSATTMENVRFVTWLMSDGKTYNFHPEDAVAFPVEMTLTPFFSPSGTLQIAIVTRDSRAMYRRFQKLNESLEKSIEINKSKTHFLANMSHELRTPLNAILGFSDVLQQELYGPLGDERYLDYASLIHEGGQHLLSIVSDILDVSRIEAGRFDIHVEKFDVRRLIKTCVSIMSHTSDNKGISIQVHIDDNTDVIVADKRCVKQIMLNLLSNAIKFSTSGTRIDVFAQIKNGQFVLQVKDQGIGIAQTEISKLGQPFVQVDSSYQRRHEGAGLGLSVVKGLVNLHKGELRIGSVLNEGTRVSVVLPQQKIEPVA